MEVYVIYGEDGKVIGVRDDEEEAKEICDGTKWQYECYDTAQRLDSPLYMVIKLRDKGVKTICLRSTFTSEMILSGNDIVFCAVVSANCATEAERKAIERYYGKEEILKAINTISGIGCRLIKLQDGDVICGKHLLKGGEQQKIGDISDFNSSICQNCKDKWER